MSFVPTAIKRKHLSLSDHRQTLDELCHWIDEHLHEPLGWQELMAQSGLDHQTLNALFYKFQSSTPMAWIRKRRELRLGPVLAAPPRSLRLVASR
ncbi:MAG: hypothetical protein Q8R72_13870 [Hylemonella sp.]|nr:hypothetical protein [Hylemonella sp.]